MSATPRIWSDSLLTGRYYYRARCGAAVGFCVYERMRDPRLVRSAIALADTLKQTAEVERLVELATGGRRYWQRRGDKWELFDARYNTNERKPWPRWEPTL